MSKFGSKQQRQINYEEMEEYGEYFKGVRLSLGLTLKEMAEEVGVFRTTLSRWEKGKHIPQTDINYILTKFKKIERKYNAGIA